MAEQKRESLVLVSEGKSAWRIVPISQEPRTVPWAASEIQRYLREISRCEIPISAPGPSEPGSAGPAIILGVRRDLAGEDRALLPPPAPGHDGYAVAVRSSEGGASLRVVIAGDGARGVAYGAYDFLERLGCRWFYPLQDPADPEVVPRSENLTVLTGAWAVASPFRFRIANGSSCFFEMDLNAARRQLDWAMKNR